MLEQWDRRAEVEGTFNYALSRLPVSEDLRNYYQTVGDTAILRPALLQASPLSLYAIDIALKKMLTHRTFNHTNIANARQWLDAMLGDCDSLKVARTRCKKLFLNQHPDKVGQRDFGSPLANKLADHMWDLLVTTRAVLAEPGLAERLYARPPWYVPVMRRLRSVAEACVSTINRVFEFVADVIKMSLYGLQYIFITLYKAVRESILMVRRIVLALVRAIMRTIV